MTVYNTEIITYYLCTYLWHFWDIFETCDHHDNAHRHLFPILEEYPASIEFVWNLSMYFQKSKRKEAFLAIHSFII